MTINVARHGAEQFDDTIVVTGSEPRLGERRHPRDHPPGDAACPMISPARMKNGIASSGKLSRLPNIVVWITVVCTSATNRTAMQRTDEQDGPRALHGWGVVSMLAQRPGLDYHPRIIQQT
jgi:hypothetical protein